MVQIISIFYLFIAILIADFQNKTKQNKTKQNKTKQNKTKQNKKEAITIMCR